MQCHVKQRLRGKKGGEVIRKLFCLFSYALTQSVFHMTVPYPLKCPYDYILYILYCGRSLSDTRIASLSSPF